LSYVLPVTAFGYVVSAFMGRFFLNEYVSPARWLGALLIAVGIGLVARTAPHTTAGSQTNRTSLPAATRAPENA
jgi:drug/metabolite transporter (DMT)-like permease